MPTADPADPTPLSTVDRWVALVAEELGLGTDVVDRNLLLDLSRDVAHVVTRPAVPLTTFLLGCAVGATGGDRAALEAAAERIAALTEAWPGGDRDPAS